MIKVIKIPVPVKPVPQVFTYVIELSAAQAYFLHGILQKCAASLTADLIVDGLNKAGLD